MSYRQDKSPSSYTPSKSGIQLERAKKITKIFFKHYMVPSKAPVVATKVAPSKAPVVATKVAPSKAPLLWLIHV